jgi:hypothetical protein
MVVKARTFTPPCRSCHDTFSTCLTMKPDQQCLRCRVLRLRCSPELELKANIGQTFDRIVAVASRMQQQTVGPVAQPAHCEPHFADMRKSLDELFNSLFHLQGLLDIPLAHPLLLAGQPPHLIIPFCTPNNVAAELPDMPAYGHAESPGASHQGGGHHKRIAPNQADGEDKANADG